MPCFRAADALPFSLLSFFLFAFPFSGNRPATIPSTRERKIPRERPPGAGGAPREEEEGEFEGALSLSLFLKLKNSNSKLGSGRRKRKLNDGKDKLFFSRWNGPSPPSSRTALPYSAYFSLFHWREGELTILYLQLVLESYNQAR